MSVYSRQLALTTPGGVGLATIFTVPAGHTYSVKSIEVYNAGAVPEALYLVKYDAVTLAVAAYLGTLASQQSVPYVVPFVVPEGQTLALAKAVAQATHVAASGFDFVD